MERSARILEFSNPNPRSATNLQKWVHGNRCIARDEVEYLTYGGNELLCMATPADSTVARMEDWVEDNLVRFSKRFYRVCYPYVVLGNGEVQKLRFSFLYRSVAMPCLATNMFISLQDLY